MANYEATKYNFDASDLTGIEGMPTATIVPWSDTSVPSGFLECNGQAVSRSTYAALFAVVSTTYGSGNGSTTFNVPDLKDNATAGRSNSKALASTGGANTVTSTGNVGGSTANATLSTPQMGNHNHPGGVGFFKTNFPPQLGVGGPGQFAVGANTGNAGSGSGHDHNMSANFTGDATSIVQPYLTLMYIIKT